MRLERALDGYWLAKRRDFSPNTVRDYELTFRRLLEHIGNKEMSAIKVADINEFLNHLFEDLELGKKTVLNAWIALSSFWSWAETELKVEHVMRTVTRPKPRRKAIKLYTLEEVRDMLLACDVSKPWVTVNRIRVTSKRSTALRDKAMILVMVDGGLRVSEVAVLTIADYHEKRGQVRVRHGKGDKQRLVPLGDAARRAIWRYLGERENVRPTRCS